VDAVHNQIVAGGGTMMIGFSVVGLLILIALMLSIAALVKYLRTQ
jgi:hypothetical protein